MSGRKLLFGAYAGAVLIVAVVAVSDLVPGASGRKGAEKRAPPVTERLESELDRVAAAVTKDRWALVLAGTAFVAGVLGAVASARARGLRAVARSVPNDPLPQVELDPLAAREAILAFAASLRPLVESPEPDIVLLFDWLLKGAVNLGASDVHFHPKESSTDIYFRVGGVLEDVITIRREHHPRLVMRAKVLAKLTTFVSDRPQDGHLVLDTANGSTDVRVSLLPTSHGEKVVFRIARGGVQLPELDALGVPPLLLQRFHAVLARPQGLIFFAGPTGAGKTMTIYSALGHIKRTRGATTQIATIEDPVEFDLPFLTQTQARPEAGFTFAHGLRSMLRQDPNVMMVGEIRDAETARIAIQAGLSGHLILTTVHAESAGGVFNRLIERGVEAFLLASASQAALSQRLVRRLCPHCRRRTVASPAHVKLLEQAGFPGVVFEPQGCERCGNRGYLGRTAIFELLEVSPAVRELINSRVPTPEIVATARSEGMVPLVAHGLERVAHGETSIEEVLRVAG